MEMIEKLFKVKKMITEIEADKDMFKRLSKQLNDRLVKSLQDNDRLLNSLEKSNNESIEVIYDLSGDNEVLKERVKELEKAMQEVVKDPLFKIHFTVKYFEIKKLLEK